MDLNSITLKELNVLSVLTAREMYGYEICKELGNKILLGSLYNILKQLERKKLVTSRWGEEDESTNARRKYYEITADGVSAVNEIKTQLMKNWGYSSLLNLG